VSAAGARGERALVPAVVAAMWAHELRRYGRDPVQVFGGASRTVLWLVILGVGLGASLRGIDGFTFAEYVLPGVITLNVLFSSLQCAITLVRDRESGILREVLASPAPIRSVTLGKLLGGATIALAQGSIPLLFAPAIGVPLTVAGVLGAWGVMFLMGLSVTALGVVIATRIGSLEGFGSISNGVIQPLYFLSCSIFPLEGRIGPVGEGAAAGAVGWLVALPRWLEVLLLANPVTYQVDLLRTSLIGLRQLPLAADLGVSLVVPIATVLFALASMARLARG
jgi:ABC-2 type transport system permease protein